LKGVQEFVWELHRVATLGEVVLQGAVQMPPENIAGAVGAGDAFAAGVLYGLHEDRPVADCLKLGVCTAATSLQHATSSEGVQSYKCGLDLEAKFGYIQF
jgi:sugar/nucleoside kinase (ribokinase family)